MKTVKRSVVARGWGEGRINRWRTEDLGDSEATLHDIIMVDTCHCTFVQTHRMYNTKNDP